MPNYKQEGLLYHYLFWIKCPIYRASPVELVAKNMPANAEDLRDTGCIPGLGRSPRGGHGNQLQCSCLENPTDSGLQSLGLQESDTTEAT